MSDVGEIPRQTGPWEVGAVDRALNLVVGSFRTSPSRSRKNAKPTTGVLGYEKTEQGAVP